MLRQFIPSAIKTFLNEQLIAKTDDLKKEKPIAVTPQVSDLLEQDEESLRYEEEVTRMSADMYAIRKKSHVNNRKDSKKQETFTEEETEADQSEDSDKGLDLALGPFYASKTSNPIHCDQENRSALSNEGDDDDIQDEINNIRNKHKEKDQDILTPEKTIGWIKATAQSSTLTIFTAFPALFSMMSMSTSARDAIQDQIQAHKNREELENQRFIEMEGSEYRYLPAVYSQEEESTQLSLVECDNYQANNLKIS